MTIQVIAEFLRLWDALLHIELSEADDRLVWRWMESGCYTSRSAYRALHLGSHPVRGCDRVWATWAPLRVKLFLWIALRRRHWTADRRRRHGLDAPDACFLCDQADDTIDHIIAECSFAKQVWWNILTYLGADASLVGRSNIIDWWEAWRSHWHGQKRKGADTLFALVAWELWKERNARLFRDTASPVSQVLSVIKHTTDLWIEAGACNLSCIIRE